MRIVEMTKAAWASVCPEVDSVYLDPRWLDVVEDVYPRLRVLRLACIDGEATLWLLPLIAIEPLLLGRPMWISVAFGNYGGFIRCSPLSDERWIESLSYLRAYVLESNAAGVEIRGQDQLPTFEVSSYFKRFSLALPQEEAQLWEGALSSNARNMVRKVTKAGVEIRVSPPDDLRTFQRLYEYQAKEHGTPIHAQAWFPRLREVFRERCYTVVATKATVPVGAALVLDGQSTSYLHAVSWSRAHRDLPVADLLYWGAIRESVARKQKALDFGRTRPVEGQLFFKRKWGAIESDLPYSYMLKTGHKVPLIVPESGKYRWATQVWRALPVPLHRMIGPFLRAHIAS